MSSIKVSALALNQRCQLQNLPRALWVSKLPTKGTITSTHFSKVSKVSEKYNLRINFVPPSKAVVGGEVGEGVKLLARETNVGEVARMMVELGATEVPDQFIMKNPEKHEFPLTPHDSYADLPVLDLSLLESQPEEVVKAVGEALRNYGFLQVVNHNVPLDLLKEHEKLAHEFMVLPVSMKSRGSLARFVGYNGGIDHIEMGTEQQAWVEALNLFNTTNPITDTILGAIWPEGNPRLKAALVNLETEVWKLSITLLDLIALSLGLSKDTFTQLFDENWSITARWSHYPRNPRPDLVLGAEGHVDPNCLTILYQDAVGGLQIKHEGKWIGVRPIEGAFVVNVGDTMQVLSNDKYMSVEHRVVTNSKQNRISVGYFVTPNLDAPISTPDELCTEDNPRKYRPFMPREYFEAVSSPRVFKFTRDKIREILGV